MSLAAFCIIVGVYEIMIGVPLVVRPVMTLRWLENALKEDTLLRLICLFFLIIGVLVLSRGTTIGIDSAGLVRLLAWVTAIKCCFLCWWPQWVHGMIDWCWDKPKVMRLFGAFATALGVWLLKVSASIIG